LDWYWYNEKGGHHLIVLFVGINAGVAGCCTGLALSFPGKVTANSVINSYWTMMGSCGNNGCPWISVQGPHHLYLADCLFWGVSFAWIPDLGYFWVHRTEAFPYQLLTNGLSLHDIITSHLIF
jgi:hypothetical protein